MFEQPEEINLDKISFEWVSEQTKPKNLRYALKLLKEDGEFLNVLS